MIQRVYLFVFLDYDFLFEEAGETYLNVRNSTRIILLNFVHLPVNLLFAAKIACYMLSTALFIGENNIL